MAQFSYEKYSQQQAAKKSNQSTHSGNQQRADIHYMNEYLKNDGDTVVVRFPYKSMDDITFETTHSVTFKGTKYPRRVRCAGDDCVLCKSKVKLDTRFFMKAVVYVVNSETGEVELKAGVWDRPAAFADIELNNLISEYGDLSDHLFKIKRNGSGVETRYTISIILNKTVYNPEVYKKDLSVIDNVNPTVIFSKTMDQYLANINGTAPATSKVEEKEEPAPSETVEEEAPVEEVEEEPAEKKEEPVRRAGKYSF